MHRTLVAASFLFLALATSPQSATADIVGDAVDVVAGVSVTDTVVDAANTAASTAKDAYDGAAGLAKDAASHVNDAVGGVFDAAKDAIIPSSNAPAVGVSVTLVAGVSIGFTLL